MFKLLLAAQECEDRVIQWVLDSDIIAACVYAIEIGSRLSKVVLNVNLFSVIFLYCSSFCSCQS